MRKGMVFAGLAALALLGCGVADGDHQAAVDSSPWISLNSVSVDTRDPSPAIPSHLLAQPGDAAAARYVLVKFPGPITAGQDRALRGAAEQVYTYLPYYSYLVKMPGGVENAAALAQA